MGLRPAKSHEKLALQDWWGGPPGPRGTPSSRCRANDISTMQSASGPTGASAADQGVRPTKPRGCGFSALSTWQRQECRQTAKNDRLSSSVLHQNRLPQAFQLAAGDLGPLSGMIQLQVGLPMVDGLHGLALAFAQQRQVEVRVGVLRIQLQRAPVEVDGFRKASLLVVQVAQVELRQGIFGIRLDGRQVVLLGLLEFVQTIVNRAQVDRKSTRLNSSH